MSGTVTNDQILREVQGVASGLTGLSRQVDGIDQRLVGVEGRLTGVEKRLTNVERNTELILDVVGNHSLDLDNHERRIKRLEKKAA